MNVNMFPFFSGPEQEKVPKLLKNAVTLQRHCTMSSSDISQLFLLDIHGSVHRKNILVYKS
jgi:hypothetical protein